jgi:hypothetical protein
LALLFGRQVDPDTSVLIGHGYLRERLGRSDR